jgi:hypothetical protein
MPPKQASCYTARAVPRSYPHRYAEGICLQTVYPRRVRHRHRHRLLPCSFKRPSISGSCPHSWPSALTPIVPTLKIPAALRGFVFGWCLQARHFVCCCYCCCCCCCWLVRSTRVLHACLAAMSVSSSHVADRALSAVAPSPIEQRNL